MAGYKLYQIISLQGDLKAGNIESASKKLLNYIKVSERISKYKLCGCVAHLYDAE